ncbi:hypothetical protein PoHVEF18_007020 [Penicillium ochrochloron]
MKGPEIQVHVRDPLGSAAAWISDGRRSNVKFSNFDGICGINGVFAGNVDFQMRYDWDPDKGFHVNAIKGNEVRAFILQGQQPGSNVGVDWHLRALKFLNNRRNGLGDQAAMTTFMSGRI